MQSGTYVLLLAFVAIASTTASVLPLVREAPWHVQRPNITLSRMYRTKIDEQCYHGDLPLVAGCNISVFICEVAPGVVASNASTSSRSVPFAGNFTNATLAEGDAIYRLLLTMEGNPGLVQRDCPCMIVAPFDQDQCTISTPQCIYFPNATGLVNNKGPYFRVPAFNAVDSRVVGRSLGWADPTKGSSNPSIAIQQAVRDLRNKSSTYTKACPAFPLVLVPGFTSTSLQYRLDDAPPPKGHPFCERNTKGWEPLWPPPGAAAFLRPACYGANMATHFDTESQNFSTRTGEQTKFEPGFGGTPSFSGLVELFAQGGWEEDKNLFIAPFDWRLPPTASESTFLQWKSLIENASAANQNQPVVMWAISGGPQWTLAFFHRMSAEWKQKYIRWFVALSPVWSGVTEGLPAVISGIDAQDGHGHSASTVLIRDLARVVPSLMWLFPRAGTDPNTTWTKDEPIVSTPSKNYTAFDIVELFNDMGQTAISEITNFTALDADLAVFTPPGVNTIIAYGSEVTTPGTYTYAEDFAQGKEIQGDVVFHNVSGDNLVPVRSSRRAIQWAGSPAMAGKQLVTNEYKGMSHAMCWNFVSGPDAPITTCMNDTMKLLRGL